MALATALSVSLLSLVDVIGVSYDKAANVRGAALGPRTLRKRGLASALPVDRDSDVPVHGGDLRATLRETFWRTYDSPCHAGRAPTV